VYKALHSKNINHCIQIYNRRNRKKTGYQTFLTNKR